MKIFLFMFGFFAACTLTGMGIEALGVTLYGWETTGAGLLAGVLIGGAGALVAGPIFYWIAED